MIQNYWTGKDGECPLKSQSTNLHIYSLIKRNSVRIYVHNFFSKCIMKKRTSSTGKVSFARVGEPTRDIEIKSGETTIAEFLEENNIELTSGESIYVDGEKANEDDILEDGDILSVAGKKDGGC